MKKFLGVVATTLVMESCHSMEFLSLEGQAACHQLKHATFVMDTRGKIVEIKLRETEETQQYREEIKKEIEQKLTNFYTKHFPGQNCSAFIDAIFLPFSEQEFQCDFFAQNVFSIYRQSIDHLLKTKNDMYDKLIEELGVVVLPILKKYSKDMTLHLRSHLFSRPWCENFFLEFSEANLIKFSEKISPELFSKLPSQYRFEHDKIRIITAASILNALEREKLLPPDVINSYKTLMIGSPETDARLLEMYKTLLDQSDFLGLARLTSKDFNIRWWHFDRGIDIDQYKANVMAMIGMSLGSEPLRQALTIFLAVNAICEKYKNEHHLEGKLMFEDLDPSRGPNAGFPCFSVNMEPNYVLECLTFSTSMEVSSFFGYAKTLSEAPKMLGHEFRHGYHIPLGLGSNCYLEYIVNYLRNPFLKDLLFKDFEQIQKNIGQDILKTMRGLSEKDTSQFVEQICSFFGLLSSWKTPKFMKVASTLQDRDTFFQELSGKLALVAINSIWDDPEEIQNIIGVQMVGDTLFINRLSDLNVSLSEGKSVHWTHLSGDKAYQKRVVHFEESERPQVTDLRAKEFIRQFYEKYSILCETSLNHPTNEALRTLQILHGLTGLVQD
jgi:hypothetical protein